MRAVVTVLHAASGSVAGAVAATVDYLCGPTQSSFSGTTGVSSAGTYYADQTCEGPGRWQGRGAGRLGLRGRVQREALEALLRGEHPTDGAALVGSRGSNRRATGRRGSGAEVRWGQAEYTFREAAELVGVDASHLRRVAGRTRALLARTGGDARSLAALEADGRAFLIAEQGDDGVWRVDHDELMRFATSRRVPKQVIGYDVTFSVPKSVSILAATADAATRAGIHDAFEQAVDVGLDYLDRYGAYAGRGADRIRGAGLVAAGFTHATSRRLDPQLHRHVLITNLVQTTAGGYRALDGSGLFAHAKTAAYLAGSALRHELTRRLGIQWRTVRSGIHEVDGVARAAIEALSARRREIDTLADELGITSAVGRREIARRSRTPKASVAAATLREEWEARLAAVGLDAAARARCLGRVAPPTPPTAPEIQRFMRGVLRHDGLTATSPTFTRGDVVQAVADWAIDRLDARGVEALADVVLTHPDVLALQIQTPTTGRGLRGRVASTAASVEPRFTTRHLVNAERRVLDAIPRGVRAEIAVVPTATLRQHLDARPELGTDQRAAIRRLCRSGDRVQCLIGPAGTGKTFALRVAADAWTSSGHRVRGVTVQGTAAENLHALTGIPSATVASMLAEADRAEHGRPVLDPNTVLVLDEASTIGTFDLARLVRLVEHAHAKLVLAGDPAQHSAVAAGGAFAALARQHSQRAGRLEIQRRQPDAAMTTVRVAVDELRRRDTDTGLHRLVVDGRILEARSRDDAYDAIVADWFSDRQHLTSDQFSSCMITEGHATRRELIRRARTRLQAAGELHGPVLRAAGQEFQAGDEVICRAPARDLHPASAPELHLRNGTLGRVVEVRPGTDHQPAGLWVEFVRRGQVFVPVHALAREIRPTIHGVLTHSYALTSHAAQGATFEVARTLATEATTPAGLYVAVSRGRRDVAIYTGRAQPDLDHEPVAGARRDERSGLQTVSASMRHKRDECLALELDPSLADRLDAAVSPVPETHPEPELAPTPTRSVEPALEIPVAAR